MMKTLLPLFAVVTAGSAAAATPLHASQETMIHDAGSGGIRDWHSDDDRSIYLRDRTGRWYYATFLGVCPGVRHSPSISFKTDALGQFDRFSTISTYRGLCSVGSVVRSPKPAAIGGR